MLRFVALKRCRNIAVHPSSFSTATNRNEQALRILFCGSDEFSAASLRALHKYSNEKDSSILSIDVAARTDKPSGRGLKRLKPPLIKSVATELGLPLHQLDTFTGWQPPEFHQSQVPSINLIIAVSFGLLIPARIINGAAFGGLNVHPSLLPDLKGAAPLNWAIIKGYSQTGVSIQTLHPTRFDEGVVLNQRGAVSIHQDTTVDELRKVTAPIGADLLVQTIREKKYLKPFQSSSTNQAHTINSAPKITSGDRLLSPSTDDLATILRKNRAIPKLFAFAKSESQNKVQHLRIIFGIDMKEASPDCISATIISKIGVGRPFAITNIGEDPLSAPGSIHVVCKDGGVLEVPFLLIEGGKQGCASQVAATKGLFEDAFTIDHHSVHQFKDLLHDDKGAPSKAPASAFV